MRDAGGVVASFASLEPEDGFGEAAAQLAGDLLAVGAPRSGLDAPLAGRVYILPTTPRGQARGPGAGRQRPVEPAFAQRAAPITLTIGEAGARFGTAVVALENPFGAPLVLVTAPGAGEGPERGRAYLFDPLAEPGEGGEHEPFAELSGLPGDAFGVAAERAEDLNGDGRADATVLSLFADDSFNTRLRRQTFTGAGELLEQQSDEESPIVRLAGDLNGDGRVDAEDLGRLLSNFGRARAAGGALVPGDLNRDGVVDGADLSLLLGGFGEEAEGTQVSEVHDPCYVECLSEDGLLILCDVCFGTDCPCFSDDDDDGGSVGSRDGTGVDGGGGGGGGTPPPPPDECEANDTTMATTLSLPDISFFKSKLKSIAETTPWVDNLDFGVEASVSSTVGEICCGGGVDPVREEQFDGILNVEANATLRSPAFGFKAGGEQEIVNPIRASCIIIFCSPRS